MSNLPNLRYVFFHEEPAPDSIVEDCDDEVDPQSLWRSTFTDTVSDLLSNAAGDEITPEEVETGHPIDLMLRLLCEMPHIVKQGYNGEDTDPDPKPAEMFQQLIEDRNLAYNLGMSLRVGMGQVYQKIQLKETIQKLEEVAGSLNIDITDIPR